MFGSATIPAKSSVIFSVSPVDVSKTGIWLTLSTGGSVLSYFSKSISKDLLDGHFLDPIIMSIKDHLDEISQ